MNLCKDCRHFSGGDDPRCHHPTSLFTPPIDLVTGEHPEPFQLRCHWARGGEVVRNQCGPDARHWEPREVGFGQ